MNGYKQVKWGTAPRTSKLARFVLFLQVFNIFLDIIYASYRKLSKEFKNNINIVVLELLIYNLKSRRPNKSSMPVLSSWTIYYKMHVLLFFKKVLIILR